jgi:hypothetical protein
MASRESSTVNENVPGIDAAASDMGRIVTCGHAKQPRMYIRGFEPRFGIGAADHLDPTPDNSVKDRY